ncbi:hypothetical protein AJ85_15835 [Alkalihalobacillus alcalophilus ATCC 27647 = CGMCC 1.3604]|uniref:Uncharacterized protein n=1 Tax=Alkalihalobacillus alcalophilus ATCC 27647 = CGMCC 1.3604 TaxID=1218173 RepID=A0A094XJR4_ALKAL|nr:hypothetical protein [Alkalihalobacillus alcalophilus]KGA99020.1 hypothetical protein BALCAV_0200895 [Alkalihalobacillus alcalophilus ATCC 27647 = CGMCC 1.3604]MED1560663.1 hypothetical protein [Alkalihalobacillus alcalophilus]THG89681.1 hypothetical protein AJ85_15835 [Alkalihalobacillus alcalophilus ATCC 27647 = CGMCC 1.3604]
MNNQNQIKEQWGNLSIPELMELNQLSLTELLHLAFQLKLYQFETPNIGRRWTEDEEQFLIQHSKELSVREASNLLYRSHYATYQRIRFLGLDEMIRQK